MLPLKKLKIFLHHADLQVYTCLFSKEKDYFVYTADSSMILYNLIYKKK